LRYFVESYLFGSYRNESTSVSPMNRTIAPTVERTKVSDLLRSGQFEVV